MVVVVAVVFHGVFLFVCNLLPVVRPFVAISGRFFLRLKYNDPIEKLKW